MRLSVIVPSGGADTLNRALASITPQLASGDEILVARLDCPWGGRARQRAMRQAAGDYLVFCDEDDVLCASALATIRFETSKAPGRVHLFGMRDPDGGLYLPTTRPSMGTVGTPMIVPPNDDRLGWWTDRYQQDWDFYKSTMASHPEGPIPHDDIVCQLRPHEIRVAA